MVAPVFSDGDLGPDIRRKLNEMGVAFEAAVAGAYGPPGWTPVFANVVDGSRIVQRVTDWVGGAGTKPATGKYVGATGLVTLIADAVNIRGASGAGSGDVTGPVSSTTGHIAVFADGTGKMLSSGGTPVKLLDVGASPAQVPAGQHLGRLAYMDELAALRATLTQPQAIGAVWVERVSDTSIKLFMRGSDGVARSTALTLS